ncbi:sodium:dicarboxylate symporter [Blastocystis sp. subtype 4]|uniref:sodium:dicarboxylate symporter n=1 Tax=Blastocystis sp. subtype 4 TaxID=944170 RepID=UPI0007120B33|nr:sodium:dicarboxylate symporter [Blastocystis sp. subtype 4]KNB41403.1 sodium:dicarboxylate symporter [Blastocystis sp. subtype 4]|eukprot:XP_014524846.1 sodium:dicarboxylate symporter [Blastocystis sp. subtype 4]
MFSSFYGTATRQSTILGDDPLFNDHDPVSLIDIARKGTQGYTKSASKLSKTLTTVGAPQLPVGIPFKKRITSPSSLGAIIGIIVSIIVMCIPLDKDNVAIQRCMGVLLIMATLWISEAIPLSVTSLLPVVLFPALNIMSAETVSSQYFNNVIFMFFAGFLMSLAMEKWNLHMRIALFIMKRFSKPRSMLLGVMLTTGFLSIFVSNTAAALMMVANCNALVESLKLRYGDKKVLGFAKAIFLGIPTLISSPPNMIFYKLFYERFGDHEGVPTISFSNWLIATLPMALILLFLTWFVLWMYCPSSKQLVIDQKFCREEYEKLGPMSYEEKVVGVGFIVLSLLWLFRVDLSFGGFTIKGWINLFPSEYIQDGTVGMTVALLLFFVPTKKNLRGEPIEFKDDEYILTWDTAKKLPWDLVLLFGGGFALAKGAEVSGLAVWIGSKMSGLSQVNIVVAVFLISIIMVLIGIFVSNTACANIMIPVVIGVAVEGHFNPLTLLFPVTCCCSCAFMLPSSTPPNLIAYTSKSFTTADLFKCGLIVSILCVIFFDLNTFTIFPAVIGYDWREVPSWAY